MTGHVEAPYRPVSAVPPEQEELADSRPVTLGDVLYAKLGKGRVPEAEWVSLIRGIAGGDQRALYALYTRSHRIVFTSILRIVKNREAAEELTVDVYHDVWRRSALYDDSDGGSVIGWIMNQARCRAIDRLRFEQRKKRSNSNLHDLYPDSLGNGGEEAVELQQTARRLREALADLTPSERQAIESAFFSEHTYVEAAARLNQPVGTVKTRIRSGLSKLRRILVTGAADI
jgi:RNA polymerase sigma-70 factor, ECF subfamily